MSTKKTPVAVDDIPTLHNLYQGNELEDVEKAEQEFSADEKLNKRVSIWRGMYGGCPD